MEIAGMCLPLKPQKESVSILHGSSLQFFHVTQPGMGVRVSGGFSTSSMMINKTSTCKQVWTTGGLEGGGLDGSQGFRRKEWPVLGRHKSNTRSRYFKNL
jgi:hypothetical protein